LEARHECGGEVRVMAHAQGCLVRRFRPGDLHAVVEIIQNSPEAARWNATAFDSIQNAGNRCWVAEVKERLTGFLAVRIAAGEAEILNVAVEPSRRRAGHAGALVREAMLELSGAAVREIYLEVRESNAVAVAFYEKLGFEKFATRAGYYRDPDEAAICMKKLLTG